LMKLLYIMDQSARAAELSEGIGTLVVSFGLDLDLLSQIQLVGAWVSVGCWLGFAGYVYLQRQIFFR